MAIRDFHQQDIVYDLLKEPFMGHVLDALLRDRGLEETCVYSGSVSFTDEEGYLKLTWNDMDPSFTEEQRAMDPQTGFFRHKRTWAELKEKYPTLPTFAEIAAEYQDYLDEYHQYDGKRVRKTLYPSWESQLDMLYHDIDNGLLGEPAKTSAFYTTLKTIKDENQ